MKSQQSRLTELCQEILARVQEKAPGETGGDIRAVEIWPHLAGMNLGKTESAVRAGQDDGAETRRREREEEQEERERQRRIEEEEAA